MSDDGRKEFMARWLKWGFNLKKRAEELGIDWRKLSMEKLEATIIFEEEWHKSTKEISHAR